MQEAWRPFGGAPSLVMKHRTELHVDKDILALQEPGLFSS